MLSLQGVQSRVSGLLKKWSVRIAPDGYYDLGKDKLPANSPRALIIYTTHYLHKVLFNKPVDEAWVNSHSAWWESVELLRLLNEAGYIVDYLDTWKSDLHIDWDKYDLVIDEKDNLRHCTSARPVKVFYCTGMYWLNQNSGELARIRAFTERTGIKTAAKRQLVPILSDQYADLQTHFGADTQLQYFTPRYGFHPLDISCVTVPAEATPKNMADAKRHFVWFGGAGFLHKGVDLAMEAFATMPEAVLHIMGGINEEPEVNEWLANMAARYPNIKLEGWMNTESARFKELLNNSIGVLLPSASEGGPTSVPQAMHFGAIPIVTERANLRCPADMGYVIRETEPQAIVEKLREAVQHLMSRPDEDLRAESERCRAYAREFFTRDAYSRSVRGLIERVAEVRQLKAQR